MNHVDARIVDPFLFIEFAFSADFNFAKRQRSVLWQRFQSFKQFCLLIEGESVFEFSPISSGYCGKGRRNFRGLAKCWKGVFVFRAFANVYSFKSGFRVHFLVGYKTLDFFVFDYDVRCV